MPPDDPPELPDGSPYDDYDDYDGPRGFADVDGGYPIEEDITESTPAQEPDQASPAPEADGDPLAPPASPLAGRRLHNPLPGTIDADDDDWYGPEPERANWKVIVPVAVLIACAGLGVWLAMPSSTQQVAQPSPAASPTPERALSRRPVQESATRRPTPTWRPSSRTPATRRTPTPSVTPTRAPSHAPSRSSSPPPSGQSTIRPPMTRQPQPRPQPTVTVTRKVKVTVVPTPPRTPHQGGPEEPPAATTRPAPSARPSLTCVTWGDCHDNPPKG